MVCFCAISVHAQQTLIEGRIISADRGYPLEKINVIAADVAVLTDASGYFAIKAAGNSNLYFYHENVLLDSLIVGDGHYFNIRLTAPINTDKRIAGAVLPFATSATANTHASCFSKGVMQGPEQLFQGRIAGLQTTSSSGDPGAFTQILMRGPSSLYLNQPLYVLDGVPLNPNNFTPSADNLGAGVPQERNALRFLNPNDIESIEVVKDATSALYGARGGNGVVYITTKNADFHRKRISYSSQISLSSVSNRYDLLDREAFLSAFEEADGNASAIDFEHNTDWQDEVFRQSVSQKHDIAFSDRFDNTLLRASIGYENQRGIVNETSMKRISGRLNLEQKLLNGRLTLNARLAYSNVKDEVAPVYTTGPDLISSIIRANPTSSSDPNEMTGILAKPTEWLQNTADESSSNIYWTNLTAQFRVIDNLMIVVNSSMDGSSSDRHNVYTGQLRNISGIFSNGKATLQNRKITNTFIEGKLSYKKSFTSGLLAATLGVSNQSFKNTVDKTYGWRFPSTNINRMVDDLEHASSILTRVISPSYFSYGFNSNSFFASYLNPAQVRAFTAPSGVPVAAVAGQSFTNDNQIRSLFLQLSYAYQNKYVINGGVRRDASNQFGSHYPAAYFPFVNVAWLMSEESFLEGSDVHLKARISHGTAGNANLFSDAAWRRETYSDIRISDNGFIVTPWAVISSPGNRELRPEKISQTNFGVDFSTGRFSVSLDLYNKVTKDMLAMIPAVQPSVSAEVLVNTNAEVVNRGVEITLTNEWLKQANSTISTSLVFSYNKNKVRSILGAIDMGQLYGIGLYSVSTQRVINDGPLYQYYLMNFTGFDDFGINTFSNGGRQANGWSPIPKINAGFSLHAAYKRFSLNGLMAGQFGHYIYSNSRNTWLTKGSLLNGSNVTADVAASNESTSNEASVSTRFLEKGDFVRLQEFSIEYRISSFTKKFHELNIGVIAQNLFVITKYSGLDPEVNTSSRMATDARYGHEYGSYPRPRIFSVRLGVSF